MKKSVFILSILLFVSSKMLAQSVPMLSNTKQPPEFVMLFEIRDGLKGLNYKKCYEFMFSVRFELDKKTGHIKDIKFSENIVDTSIIGVVRRAFISRQSMWNLTNCKKQNPSLVFLQPIWIHIHNRGCIPMNTSDPFHPDANRQINDFDALATFPKDEYSRDSVVYNQELFWGCLYNKNKPKFVGMLLNPISIGVSEGYD